MVKEHHRLRPLATPDSSSVAMIVTFIGREPGGRNLCLRGLLLNRGFRVEVCSLPFRSLPERKRDCGVVLAWPFSASLPWSCGRRGNSKCQQRVILDVSVVVSTDTLPLCLVLGVFRWMHFGGSGTPQMTQPPTAPCPSPQFLPRAPHSSPIDRTAAGRSSSLVVRDRPTAADRTHPDLLLSLARVLNLEHLTAPRYLPTRHVTNLQTIRSTCAL